VGPAENAQVRQLLRAGTPYVLFVGVPDARKNAAGMMLAVAAASGALRKELKLVIAGSLPSGLEAQLRAQQAKIGLTADQVVLPGYIEDGDLAHLYRGAQAMLFPSLYEGFGFPIVEAMMAGCPAIAGANSSQVEVAGDAALMVDARNVEEIAGAILRVMVEPGLRERLIRDGLVRAQKFTWEKVAEKTSMYLREFLTRQGGGVMPAHENATERTGMLETVS
jgi:glycosyltransferase involved in cell wall biosynthesis